MLKRKGYPEDIEKYIDKLYLKQCLACDEISTNINTEWVLRGNKANRQVRLLSEMMIRSHLRGSLSGLRRRWLGTFV